MKKKLLVIFLIAAVIFVLAACREDEIAEKQEKTSVNVFVAASLGVVMNEFEKQFEKENPYIDIVVNADSSGTLMTQIEEGAPCDVFFSAAQKQMDELEDNRMVVEGTRTNVVNNQLVVVTQPKSKTTVTGLRDIGKAKSIALADGSVPVGKYTRQAMIRLELLKKVDNPETITTNDVSKQLGGVQISEQGNVSKVLSAVEEGASEIGTVYLSDTKGHEKKIKIIETVGYDVTGDIIYPVAQIVNKDATAEEKDAAANFIKFITNDDAKKLYKDYGFDTNLK